MSNIQKLRLDEINILAGTQSRAATNEDTVREYTEALEQGVEFPPVVVFSDGSDNGKWLADGFHRYFAHQKASLQEIACDVRVGTLRDAKLFSNGANGTHGLPRTNADKNRAVMNMLADDEWKTWSQEQIAKACHVSTGLVSKIINKASLHGEEIKPATRTVTRNGVTYEQKTTNIGKPTTPAVAPFAPPISPTNTDVATSALTPAGVDSADAPHFGVASPAPTVPATPLTVDDIDDDGADFDVMDRLVAAEDQVKQLERERDGLKARVAQLEAGDLAAHIVKLEQDLRIVKDRAERRYKEFTDANKKAMDRAELLDRIRRAAGVGKDVDLIEWVKQAARRAA